MDYVGFIEGKYNLVKLDYMSKLVELDVCDRANSGPSIEGVKK